MNRVWNGWCFLILLFAPKELTTQEYSELDYESECPTMDQLAENNAFLDFSRVSHNIANITWDSLWASMDWSWCVSDILLFLDKDLNTEMKVPLANQSQKWTEISMDPPCAIHTVVLQITLQTTGEVVTSLGKNKPRQILPVANPSASAALNLKSWQELVIVANMEDLIKRNLDDKECLSVFQTAELFVHQSDDDWRSIQKVEASPELKFTMDLTDFKFCATNKLKIRLESKDEGIITDVIIGSIPSRTNDPQWIEAAVADGVVLITATNKTDFIEEEQRSITLYWANNSPCISNHILEISGGNLDPSVNILSGNATSFKIEDLEPCNTYKVHLYPQFGAYNGSAEALYVTTKPDFEETFLLESLKIEAEDDDVRVSWEAIEYPCLFAENYHVYICNSFDDECLDIVEPITVYSDGKTTLWADIKDLNVCSEYQIRISVFAMNDSSWKMDRIFKTQSTKLPVQNLTISDVDEDTLSVSLMWLEDACAIGYLISFKPEEKEETDYTESSIYYDSDDASSGDEEGSGKLRFDDEDYPEGSGSEYEEVTSFTNFYTLTNLKACQNYHITVQAYYPESELGNHKSDYGPPTSIKISIPCPIKEDDDDEYDKDGEVSAVLATTIQNIESILALDDVTTTTASTLIETYDITTVISTTTSEPLIPVQNVSFELTTINGSLFLNLSWIQSKGVQVDLELNHQLLPKEVQSDDENYFQVMHRVKIDFCSDLNIEISDGFTGESYWNFNTTTMIDPQEVITIPDLSVNNNTGILTWTSIMSISCFDEYLFTILHDDDDDDKEDEAVTVQRSINNTELDLNEILTLIPCTDYRVNVNLLWKGAMVEVESPLMLPITFNPHKDNDLSIDSVASDSVQLTLGRFSCFKKLEVSWTNLETSVTHNEIFSRREMIEITGLDSCTVYNLNIMTNDGDVGEKFQFKTTAGLSDPAPLTPDTVNIIAIRPTEVHIEWADRCLPEYVLKIDSQRQDQIVQKTSELSVLITDLHPCTLYNYTIEYGSLILFQSSFESPMNEVFELEPNLELNDDILRIAFDHVRPCILSYLVTITDSKNQIILSENVFPEKPETLFEIDSKLGFIQCRNYSLNVYLELSEDNNALVDDQRPSYIHDFTYRRDQYPPVIDLMVKKNNDEEIKINWNEPQHCVAQYYRLRIYDASLLIKDITNLTDTNVVIRDLLTRPCTRYHISVTYFTDNFIESLEARADLVTDHSYEVGIEPEISFNQIQFSINSTDFDCLNHYVMTLCNFLSSECSRQSWYPGNKNESLKFLFTGLKSGTSYLYQLTGLDDSGAEIFFNSDRQINTNVKVTQASVKASSSDKEDSVTINFTSSIFRDYENPIYQLKIKCESEDKEVFVLETNEETPILIIDGLKVNTVLNCSGDLIFDNETFHLDSFEARTLEGIPSEPFDLKTSEIGPTMLNLEWSPPKEPNGIIQEYLVKVTILCDLKSICYEECSQIPERELSTFEPFVSVNKLEPFQEYSISVKARTNRSEYGPWSNPSLTVQTAPGPPHKPVIKSLRTMNDTASVLIHFEYPCLLTGQTHFDVSATRRVTHHHARRHRKHMIESQRGFVIEGLEGGHHYDVTVLARVSTFTERSEVESVYLECRFRCDDGTCINKNWDVKCDFIRDCLDGSDEDKGCSCDSPRYFQCSNGFCLNSWQRCDGTTDCFDFSDETGCPGCLGESQFMCRKSGKCIDSKRTCDRKVDCEDSSDEYGCSYWKKSCWPDEFRCLDARCINIRSVCDGIWDCPGGEDERSCNSNVCSEASQFACKSSNPFIKSASLCIPLHKYCDGESDCADGSDESFGCNCHMIGKFACLSGDQCTDRLRVCDEIKDCRDGSDEMDCDAKVDTALKHTVIHTTSIPTTTLKSSIITTTMTLTTTSKSSITMTTTTSTTTSIISTTTTLTTIGTSTTVMIKKNAEILGPKYPDYPFLDKSENRIMLRKPRPWRRMSSRRRRIRHRGAKAVRRVKTKLKLKLMVYPEFQSVSIGGDVVMQCRDESNLRAEVYWTRPSGLRFPKNMKNIGHGRLEIYNIQREEAGVYECKAKNMPSSRSAKRAYVHIDFHP